MKMRRSPKRESQPLVYSKSVKPRPRWQRWAWLVCGAISLAIGVVGIVLPLLPTTPFVLLAAYCFSLGSVKYEHWLLTHPRFGPMVRNWRANRAVPLRIKQIALITMVLSSGFAWWTLPAQVGWIPGTLCTVVGIWLWRLPTASKTP